MLLFIGILACIMWAIVVLGTVIPLFTQDYTNDDILFDCLIIAMIVTFVYFLVSSR